MKLIYFPGFGGGSQSTGYNFLAQHYPETTLIIYDNLNADNAYEQIQEQLKILTPEHLIIGQSLGGFWAEHFAAKHNQKVILINPSLKPFVSLEKFDVAPINLERFKKYKSSDIAKQLTTIFLSDDDDVVNPAPVKEKYDGIARFVQVSGGHIFRHFDVLQEEISKMK